MLWIWYSWYSIKGLLSSIKCPLVLLRPGALEFLWGGGQTFPPVSHLLSPLLKMIWSTSMQKLWMDKTRVKLRENIKFQLHLNLNEKAELIFYHKIVPISVPSRNFPVRFCFCFCFCFFFVTLIKLQLWLLSISLYWSDGK